MASRSLDAAFQRLRFAMGQHDEVGLPDARLLGDFISRGDQASFAVLVRRHARMVMGVCLRVARHRQDAEDAFQATFLVLVRKAAAIAQPELLANWLYRVAHNTALKANAEARKRRLREEPLTSIAEPAGIEAESRHSLLAVLDQELSRLPDKYRVPIILCDLEGKTQKNAARLLGCPEKTLSSRLIRARDMLARRLTRLGLAASCGTLLSALTQDATCASTSLLSVTVKAASALAAGHAAAEGVISTSVAVLMEGVLQAMFLKKLKMVVALLLVIALAGYGGGRLVLSSRAAQEGRAGTVPAQEKKEDGGAEKKKETPSAADAETEKKDTSAQNETYVHRAIYIRARDAESTLRSFLLSEPKKKPNESGSKVAITSDDRTNTVFVIGTPDNIAQAKRVLSILDVGTVPYQVRLPFPRKSPNTLDEVVAELKNARASLERDENDLKTVAELDRMGQKVGGLELTIQKLMRSLGPNYYRVKVAESRIHVEMLVVLDHRMRELDRMRTLFQQGVLPKSGVEEATQAVEKARKQLERFEGF